MADLHIHVLCYQEGFFLAQKVCVCVCVCVLYKMVISMFHLINIAVFSSCFCLCLIQKQL